MTVTDQFIADVRQSPGRAAVLALGVVVAGFVWGPRLRAAFGSPAGSVTEAVGDPVVVGGSVDPVGPTEMGRNASEIRAEFEQIAGYAAELRGRAILPDRRELARDPFFREPPKTVIQPATGQRTGEPAGGRGSIRRRRRA